MIRFEHLGKIFKGRCALEDLTLEIPKGEIFGLLGHNGAGKSTTFGMLLGQVYPTKGEAFIRGVSVQRERSKALRGVGAIFETPGFYDYLTGWNNLRIFTGYTAKLSNAELEENVRFVGLAAYSRSRPRLQPRHAPAAGPRAGPASASGTRIAGRTG